MEFLSKFLTLVYLVTLINSAMGYKILAIFPLTIKSHEIFCQSVIKTLAKHGHQVDVIVASDIKNSYPEKITIIYNLMELLSNNTIKDLKLEKFLSNASGDPVKFISEIAGNYPCQLLGNVALQNIIQKLKANSNYYDVLIVEAFTMNCFMGLAKFLNIPMITLSAQNLFPWVEEAIGIPTTVATHPTILTKLVEINSFWERLQNTIEKHLINYKFHYYTDKIQTELIRKYISADLPNVEELTKNSILTLSNTHFSVNGIKPVTPALIEVGGLHILQDDTKLTPQLQKWMDESENGVIYFSMGTIILVESLPEDFIFALNSVIRKLKPIRFLIRAKNIEKLFPNDENLLENIKILPWIPQIPVLNHKNTKAFITHCGLLSSLEAIYFGIPIIGMPVAADQFINNNQLNKKNMGIKLNFRNITETILFDTLMVILNNSTYREAAKNASILFKDRPINVEKATIYWIEYVLRNGGILKSPAVNLHWAQKELLDVYGFLLISFILIFYINFYIIRNIIRVIIIAYNKSKSKSKIIKKKKVN